MSDLTKINEVYRSCPCFVEAFKGQKAQLVTLLPAGSDENEKGSGKTHCQDLFRFISLRPFLLRKTSQGLGKYLTICFVSGSLPGLVKILVYYIGRFVPNMCVYHN